MSESVVLGIDLGTTNSVVAVADGERAEVLADLDGQKLIPSVVSFLPDGKVIAGELARERRLVDARNTVYAIKRLIGRPFDAPEVRKAQERFAFELVRGDNGGVRVDVRGETYALAEVSAYVLRECRRVAEQVLGRDCQQAVITVPANFNELQRSATKAAGKVAGLDVLRILNEPTAAAVAHGYGAEHAETVAVYDFGGGTFDITILELDGDVFEVVATAGDTFLGGEDIDLLVAEDMADTFRRLHRVDPRKDDQAFERLRAAAEWTKCQLSTKSLTKTHIAGLMPGPAGTPLDFEYHTTRMKLEDRIRPLVDRSLEVCREALRLASREVGGIDRVVLVGGSTRIPLVRSTVQSFFGKTPRIDLDPDLVVALGASIQALALAKNVPRRTLSLIQPPSAEAVAEVVKKKETARMERPAQPAFAPVIVVGDAPGAPASAQAYRPPTPLAAPAPLPDLEHDLLDLGDALEELVSSPPPASARAGLPAALMDPDDLPPLPAPGGRQGAGARREDDFSDLVLPPVSSARTRPVVPEPAAATPWGELDAGPRASEGRPAALQSTLAEAPEPEGAPGGDPPARPRAPPPEDWGALEAHPGHVAPRQALSLDGKQVVPLLMDVTPHSLGIRTAGGWCEHVIRRNAPIPVEQTRLFTTAQDGQDAVHVVVCQGESRAYQENEPLGEIVLSELRSARRGEIQIEVTFMLDANGTLDVSATDVTTRRAQRIRVNLVGGFEDSELAEMRQRQEATMQG